MKFFSDLKYWVLIKLQIRVCYTINLCLSLLNGAGMLLTLNFKVKVKTFCTQGDGVGLGLGRGWPSLCVFAAFLESLLGVGGLCSVNLEPAKNVSFFAFLIFYFATWQVYDMKRFRCQTSTESFWWSKHHFWSTDLVKVDQTLTENATNSISKNKNETLKKQLRLCTQRIRGHR